MLELLVLVLVLGSVGTKMDHASASSKYDVQQERCALRRTRNGDLEQLAHG